MSRNVTSPKPISDEPKGRVLQFRPRGAPPARAAPPPVPDLVKYERGTDDSDDYRHRMKMNAVVAAVTTLLIVGGIWIAETMAQMRKNQDCVLVGRTGCTPVNLPVNVR